MEQYDGVVVGAGVIGLAIARRLALSGAQILILEKNPRFGEETSSRNSEVVHAGIYYPNNSLKARLCVDGRHLLYRYCGRRAIPHRRCGKLIVAATADQEPWLERIAQNASRNGVTDLAVLEGREARRLEPAVQCTMALLSPSTGIIDSHALMQALLADGEAAGAVLACRCEVTRVVPAVEGLEVFVDGATSPTLRTRWLVNAAGLHAATLAARIDGFPAGQIPDVRFAKGNYFALAGLAPFSRLVYPTPEPGGLGVHMTLDLGGRARFGPDVEWIDRIDYRVDPSRAHAFCEQIAHYWPSVTVERLRPDYAGIRPKVFGREGPFGDFLIEGPAGHGVPGIINLFGIESPGLTACLAVAEHVAQLIEPDEAGRDQH